VNIPTESGDTRIGRDTQDDHEETYFEETEAGIFPELEIQEGAWRSSWKTRLLREINQHDNRNLPISTDQ